MPIAESHRVRELDAATPREKFWPRGAFHPLKALTYHGPRCVRFEDVPDPALEDPRDVIVQVELAAICGSDLHVYDGREVGLDAGTVMGHEFAGRIVELGLDAGGLGRGDFVVSPFTTNCGRCFFCSTGLTARCTQGQLFGWVEDGAGLHGGQAQYVRVPLADSTLLRVPDDLAPEPALLLGDVLATGFHCAHMAEVAPSGAYVVLGCGPVGLMAVVAARELGAERIHAVDLVPERLALAERLGATPVDAGSGDAVAVVRDATEGRGADAVLEAVGSPEAGRLAYELVRAGGIISTVGVHHEPHFAFSPGKAYDKNLTLRSGRCPARGLMERLLPIARRRRDDLAALITHRLPLSDGPEAYEMFDARRAGCIKVALWP